MTDNPRNSLGGFLKPVAIHLPRVAGIVVALFGLLVAASWLGHWTPIIQLSPNSTTMKFNTALGFILSGAALAFLTFGRYRTAASLAAVAALAGVLPLLENSTGRNFHVDQLFVRDYINAAAAHPGRLSPMSASCFLLFCSALFLAGLNPRHKWCLTGAGVLASVAAVVASIALLGYTFDIQIATGWGAATRTAPHSATCFVLLNIGLLTWLARAARSGEIDFARFLPLTAALTLIGMIAIISGAGFIQLQRAIDWQEHTTQVILRAQSFLGTLADSQRGMRGYALGGRPEFLALFREATNNAPVQLRELFTLTADNSTQQQRLARLRTASENLVRYGALLTATRDRQGLAAAAQIESNGNGKAIMDQARFELDAFTLEEQRLLATRNKSVGTYFWDTARLSILGCIIAAALLMLANLVVNSELANRRRVEQQIRQSEERFRLTIESVKDYAIFMLDPNGNVQTWSGGAERIKGYRADEIIGRHLSTFYPPESLAIGLPEKILAEARAVGSYENEGWRVRKDGSRFFADVIITAIPGENGQIRGFVKVTRDITERKRIEEKLADQAEELKRSNRELEQFAYVASHDMQEPLRAVNGFAQILQRVCAAKLDERELELLRHLTGGAQRMASIIDDLLALSRVGSHGKPFERAPLESPLKLALANLSVTIRERNAVIQHNELPAVPMDSSQIMLLFQNLVGNAIKFSGERAPEVNITSARTNGHWTISVRDNGIGIEQKYFERIFGMFQRLHSRDKYPGTGIGLAICKKVVERHGGKIWLESAPGAGTTFHFTLPEREKASKYD